MLKLVSKLSNLSFSCLMEVYLEGNLEKAGDSQEGLLREEQAFFSYLAEVFFPTPGAAYAIWEDNGRYASALRLEPYRDGLLVEALETAPQLRRRGFARSLLGAVQEAYKEKILYSHVAKGNAASRRLHEGLGFRKISDRAVYIDGSVNDRCVTYSWNKNTST